MKKIVVSALFCAALAPQAGAEEGESPLSRINHIVVIVTENRSFDHVFGLFPGAEGLEAAAGKNPQIDRDGTPLSQLPFPFKHEGPTLPNAPFLLEGDLAGEEPVDPIHDFHVEQEQIDGGRMDRFVEASNAGGLVMGYRDGRKLDQWRLAQEFTLADHFFHAAYGGSMINHFFLVCACPPLYENPPAKLVAALDENGRLLRRDDSPQHAADGPPKWRAAGRITPDGIAYGTFAPFAPISATSSGHEVLPPQNAPTIGDRLDDKQVSWAWYAAGLDDVIAGRSIPYRGADKFQTHHHPFLFFKAFGPGGKGRGHIRDAAEFFAAADAGDLPSVSFYKPIGRLNEHPNYSDFEASDAHIGEVVARLRASPNWRDMLIVVVADENGGYWDHVAPPKFDRFGAGARVPAIIVSPFARKGFVDHTVYDTTSILRTIEVRFGLAPLGPRDAAASDLGNALEPHRGASGRIRD